MAAFSGELGAGYLQHVAAAADRLGDGAHVRAVAPGSQVQGASRTTKAQLQEPGTTGRFLPIDLVVKVQGGQVQRGPTGDRVFGSGGDRGGGQACSAGEGFGVDRRIGNDRLPGAILGEEVTGQAADRLSTVARGNGGGTARYRRPTPQYRTSSSKTWS